MVFGSDGIAHGRYVDTIGEGDRAENEDPKDQSPPRVALPLTVPWSATGVRRASDFHRVFRDVFIEA
jgi:hypothetical protein